jgi:hypothetical protein
MKPVLSIYSLWLVAALASPAWCQRDIDIELSLVRLERGTEVPWKNAYVQILPSEDATLVGRTDSNGMVRFRFNSSKSVVFWVGTDRLSLNTRLGPLSGRKPQTFSHVYDLNASTIGVARTVANVYSMHSENPDEINRITDLGTKQWHLELILNDLRTQSGGRLMPEQSRDYLRELKTHIGEFTKPRADATEEEQRFFAQTQAELFQKIDDLLAPPWKLGVSTSDRLQDLQGLRVDLIVPESPAARVGIRPGELIMEIDGIPLKDLGMPFRWMIANAQAPEIELTVRSPATGEERKIQATLSR